MVLVLAVVLCFVPGVDKVANMGGFAVGVVVAAVVMPSISTSTITRVRCSNGGATVVLSCSNRGARVVLLCSNDSMLYSVWCSYGSNIWFGVVMVVCCIG